MALAQNAAGAGLAATSNVGMGLTAAPNTNMHNVAQWKPSVGDGGSSHTHGASCHPGCGGAYDLRAFEKKHGDSNGICLGIDFGTSRIRAGVWQEKGDSKAALDVSLFKGGGCTGVQILDGTAFSKWLKGKKKSDKLPKGCKLITTTKTSSEKDGNIIGIKRMIGMSAAIDIPSFLDRPEFLSFLDEKESKKDQEDEEFASPTVKLSFKEKEIRCGSQDLLALVVVGLKQRVAKAYGGEVVSAVVTVPAIFTDRQRVAVQAALFKAGISPRRLLSSPVAALVGAIECPLADVDPVLQENGEDEEVMNEASLADHVYNAMSPESHALCIGMGAGFSEVGVVRISYKSTVDDEGQETGYLSYKTLCVDGMVYGGMDVDNDICHNLYLGSGAQVPELDTVRGAREALSTKEAVKFRKPILQEDKQEEEMEWILERKQLNNILEGPLKSLENAAKSALASCSISPDQIDFVLTFGGMSKTPAFMEMAKSLAPKSGDKLFSAGVDSQCRGAIYLFATLEGKEGCGDLPLVALDVLPSQLAIQTPEGLDPLFADNTPLPASVEKEYQGEVKSQYLTVVQTTHDNVVIPTMKITHPQIITDLDRGDTWHAESVKVKFSLDESGVLNIASAGDPPTRPKPPLSWTSWLFRIVLVTLALGYISWRLYYKFVVEVAQYQIYHTRLVAFYEEVNPDKVDSIDELLTKFKGKEEVLIRKLERKYDIKIPTLEEIEQSHKGHKDETIEEVSFDEEQEQETSEFHPNQEL